MFDWVLSMLDDEAGAHDLRHIRSLVVVGRDHFRENIEEIVVWKQAVLVHLLILLKEKLKIPQQSILNLNSLTHILVINDTLTTVTEMRLTYIEFRLVMNGLALEFDGQFHLAWATGRNLHKNNSKGEDVRRSGGLEEFNIYVTLLVHLVDVATLRKTFNLEQMRCHVWRHVINLVWNADLISFLYLNNVSKIHKLDSFDFFIISTHFYDGVFGSQVAIHCSWISYVLKQRANLQY